MAKFVYGKDVATTIKDWAVALRSLTFGDNFRCQIWEGSIEAGEEKRITHILRLIPTQFLIVEANGVNTLVKGVTKSTAQFFYVKNIASTSTFNGKIIIIP